MKRRRSFVWLLVLACGPQADDRDDGTAASAASESGGAECVTSDIGEPPDGDPGGFCLLGSNTCAAGVTCKVDDFYCYLESDPCSGFDCGGSQRGCCAVEAGLPVCMCNAGFENETFPHYCCPTDGSDPDCP